MGHLIVVLSGDEAQRQQALTYLAKQGVRTNVLKTYQQTKKAEFTGDLKRSELRMYHYLRNIFRMLSN